MQIRRAKYVKRGTVAEWDRASLRGEVRLVGGGRAKFIGTCFDSSRPGRWPTVGDTVEVIYSNPGEVLAVHLT